MLLLLDEYGKCPDQYSLFEERELFFPPPNGTQVDSNVQACSTSTSIGDLENKQSDVKLFPNPANNNVYLNFDLQENAGIRWKILYLLGQTVMQTKETQVQAGTQKIGLDVSQLSVGLYSLILLENGSIKTVRKLNVSR